MLRRTTALLFVGAAEATAIVALHRLGSHPVASVDWHDLPAWLAEVPPEHALVAAVRVLAMGLACWLAGTTLMYAAARLARIPAVITGTSWITAPAVRRLVDGVVASSIIASASLTSPAMATAAPIVEPVSASAAAPPSHDGQRAHAYTPTPVGDGTPTEASEPVYTPRPAGEGEPATTSTTSTTVPPPPASTAAPPETPHPPLTYVVASGDNLWQIAETVVADHLGVAANDLDARDVHTYWLRLIDANRARLRSGDPDLVYPGEVVELPASRPAEGG